MSSNIEYRLQKLMIQLNKFRDALAHDDNKDFEEEEQRMVECFSAVYVVERAASVLKHYMPMRYQPFAIPIDEPYPKISKDLCPLFEYYLHE